MPAAGKVWIGVGALAIRRLSCSIAEVSRDMPRGHERHGQPLILPERAEGWAGPLVGAVTGLVTGATGVFVLPIVPYLAGLGREALIQGMWLAFTIATIGLALGLVLYEALTLPAVGLSALAVLPALAGMMLGAVLRERIASEAFRVALLIGLGAMGAQIVLAA